MSWLLASGDRVVLALHIQPGTRKTEIVGLHGEALKIRLAAPPVDGKANDALITFLAETLGIPKSQLSLLSGQSSRRKRVAIAGADIATVGRQLSPDGGNQRRKG